MEKLKRVVGIAFVEEGKLLIVRSQRSTATNSWTLVGGLQVTLLFKYSLF